MQKSVILCIDDESIILRSLRTELRDALDQEHFIEVAESGQEALDIARELFEDGLHLEVVICDYIMPDIKGDEVLAQIHKVFPQSRKIMLTGQSSIEGITNAINQANLYRFIAKPWDPEDMLLTVKEAVKSYRNDLFIAQKNRELEELNAQLEQKVIERTRELERANLELSSAVNALHEQKQIIEKKSSNITSSINYAQQIQKAILTPEEMLKDCLGDYFIIYKPRDIVSGDFYWCEKIEERPVFEKDPIRGENIFKGIQNEKVILAAVDCTGHGVPGAFMSMIANDLLNGIIIQHHFVEADQILNKLHKGIRTALRQRETQNKDGLDVALCIIDRYDQTLEYAGAKNPLIYFQNNELHHIRADKLPVGGAFLGAERFYTKHIIDISQETTLYIFSDGFQDQFGGPYKRKFMIKRLKEILWEIHQKPMPEQQKILEEHLHRWMGTQEAQIDDILLIGVHLPL
ncbi:MAG: response regulator [Microscillaceae bacterium]|nr:response regulator [Microscillaceae bacterium]